MPIMNLVCGGKCHYDWMFPAKESETLGRNLLQSTSELELGRKHFLQDNDHKHEIFINQSHNGSRSHQEKKTTVSQNCRRITLTQEC